jgi:hypothetical protein
MIWRWIQRLTAVIGVLITLLVIVVIIRTNPDPWSAQEIEKLTIGLNEAAAIGVPHDFLMQKQLRSTHLALLEKVEVGVTLSKEESLQYRHVFQQTLQDSQGFLAAFDRQLTVLSNHAMQDANNVDTHGVAGHHDHHDVSARANFAGLLDSLDQLDQAYTPFGRIIAANRAQKDLVDLISHLGVAPHTVSIGYGAPEIVWRNGILGGQFEEMLKAFKAAQFEPVNSARYWRDVDLALAHYNDLILSVQKHIISRTTSWERRIFGRFLSMQTLAPPVDLNRPLRRE